MQMKFSSLKELTNTFAYEDNDYTSGQNECSYNEEDDNYWKVD